MTASQNSSLCSSAGCRRMMPALLTRMSTRPYTARASAARRAGTAGSPRSAANVAARRPSRSIAARCPREASRRGARRLHRPRPGRVPCRHRDHATRRSPAPPCRPARTDRRSSGPGRRVTAPARKSSRGGLKMSTSTTGSSSIVAPCAMPDGKNRTSPADAIRSTPSTMNRTRPRSTIVICSCGCECTGVTMSGANERRQTISRSPRDHLALDAVGDPLGGMRRPVLVLKRGRDRWASWARRSPFVEARSEHREIGMDVDDAVLAIRVFDVRGHHPHEVDRAARRGDVRVISLRHQHDVALVDDRREFRIMLLV